MSAISEDEIKHLSEYLQQYSEILVELRVALVNTSKLVGDPACAALISQLNAQVMKKLLGVLPLQITNLNLQTKLFIEFSSALKQSRDSGNKDTDFNY